MTSGWKRDEGYSGCKTKRINEYALVICEPSYYDRRDGWGFQAFCEGDWDMVESGDYCYSMEGIWSEEAAMQIAEMWAREQF